jgi:hypothetical protein
MTFATWETGLRHAPSHLRLGDSNRTESEPKHGKDFPRELPIPRAKHTSISFIFC